MGNLVIATPTWSDLATLTASSELASAPVANLQRMQPTDLFQAASSADFYLEADRGSAQPFNLVALLYTNVGGSGTWRVRAADTQGGLTSSPPYDSGSLTFWASPNLDTWTRRHSLLWIPAGVTRRWVRIDVGSVGATFQGGRLYIGQAWQPSRNYQYGGGLGHVDLSPKTRANGLHTVPTAKPTLVQQDFQLDFLSEAEMYANLFELRRLRGATKDVLVCLNPDDTTYRHQAMCYGLLDWTERITRPAFKRFAQNFRIEELV